MSLIKKFKSFWYGWFPRDWKDMINWSKIPDHQRPDDRKGYPPYEKQLDEPDCPFIVRGEEAEKLHNKLNNPDPERVKIRQETLKRAKKLYDKHTKFPTIDPPKIPSDKKQKPKSAGSLAYIDIELP